MLVGSRPRSKGMERKDLIEANAAIFSVQGKAHRRVCVAASESARRRQSGQHELSDRATQRTESRYVAVHCDDAARSQPCKGAARQQDRETRQRRERSLHLGKSLRHAVPGSARGDGRRQTGARARGKGVVHEAVHPDSATEGRCRDRSARCIERGIGGECRDRSHARLGARLGGRRRRQHGRVFGRQLRRRRRACSYSFPVVCRGGKWKIVQGRDINTFSREKMLATEKELREERDAVAHLLPR